MYRPETIPGTPGVAIDDVTQLLVPGRGRDPTGMGLSPESAARYAFAAAFFREHKLLERGGTIVCVGYKTPRDHSGEPWTDPEGTVYQGVPEAISGAQLLIEEGVPKECIRVEYKSQDTPDNFVRGRDLLDRNRAAGIAAQEGHLLRMINVIAGRTLYPDIPYIGLVVPEDGTPAPDSLAATLHSRFVLRNMTHDDPELIEITERRSELAWRALLTVERAALGAKRVLAIRK
jgi:hypothetical protein